MTPHQLRLLANNMNILGIDIGTTTITALILDTCSNSVIACKTLKNDSFIEGRDFEKLQDTQIILDTVKSAVADVTESSEIHAIGVTGQMHGILYLDKENKPCSPLMIWQDERGNLPYNGTTYAAYLTEKTGYKAASGFGLTTHFYNTVNNEIPENAVKLSTIHDYIVSVLTGSDPVTHSSDAASLGFFDLEKSAFDTAAISSVGMDCSFLPKVLYTTSLAGKTNCEFLPSGIPVSVAIGDNQASFLGSVADPENSVLVNVGTGSQISFITHSTTAPSCGEIRPLTDGSNIFVGASLCGGRAYAVLKNFFSMCADMLGGSKDNLYAVMDALSEDVFTQKDSLKVNCEFCGTRDNPEGRGSITNISDSNLTPKGLITGVLKGVCEELHNMYTIADDLLISEPSTLVCSGNGLRKSAIWREIFKNSFSLETQLPKHSEEAATGACIFASVASKIFPNINEAQNTLLR